MVAEAMGIRGITIDDTDNLEVDLEKAFAHKGQLLVNVLTDRTALAMPPHIDLKMVKAHGPFHDQNDARRQNGRSAGHGKS